MADFGFLQSLLVTFALAGVMMWVCSRLRIPTLIGLMGTGVVVGRSGFDIIEPEQVEMLAEIGVVVLLFTVGLEFSLTRLLGMWKVMLSVGAPQVGLCLLAGGLAARSILGEAPVAILMGMMLAMSSTAIALKLLIDRGELTTPHGRLSTSILLFQDLLVIAAMLAVPALAAWAGSTPPEHARGHGAGFAPESPLLALVAGLAVVAAILASAKYVLPPILYSVVGTRNREVFLVALVVICIGTAAATAAVGLSLALGAFLAGLALSESDYSHQMMSEILPFRDTLSSLFFISVGMLLNLRYLWEHMGEVALIVGAIAALKFASAAIPAWWSRFAPRTALLTGAALSQIGEFSFLLAERGRETGLLSAELFTVFISAAVLSMMLSVPIYELTNYRLNRVKAGTRLHRLLEGREARELDGPEEGLREHVIIAGFGMGGQNLARTLRSVSIPYTVIDNNPERVRRLRAAGERIGYGDCSRQAILEHAGIATARMLVIVISDATSARHAARLARQLNPTIHIVVRTPYLSEIEELERLGANEIIPEDFVASVEIFERVLRRYEIPRRRILELIDELREDQYELLRDPGPSFQCLRRELASEVDVATVALGEDSAAAGRSIAELQIRSRTGATVIGVRREGRLVTNPSADFTLRAGDMVVLIGDDSAVERAGDLLNPSAAAAGGEGAA